MARRKKISVSKDVIEVSEKHNSQNIIPLNLIVDFEREFSKNFSQNISSWIEGISSELKERRTSELVSFVGFMNLNKSITGETKYGYFRVYKNFFNICKNTNYIISDERNVRLYRNCLLDDFNSGKITKSTLNKKRKQIKSVFNYLYSVDSYDFDIWFPQVGMRTGKLYGALVKEKESKAYTQEDFVLLLTFILRAARFYRKLHDKKSDIETLKHTNFEFYSKNGICADIKHQFNGMINKSNFISNFTSLLYMYALMSITGINKSSLLRVRRSQIQYDNIDGGLIRIYITDKRKGFRDKKKEYIAKKHYGRLINEIIEFSKSVNSNEETFLLPYNESDGSITMLPLEFIAGFTDNQFRKKKNNYLTGHNGQRLIPSARKIRHSYGLFFDGSKERSIVLSNKKRTSDKHYSDGNSSDNNSALQKGMHLYEESLVTNMSLYELVKKEREGSKVNIIGNDEVQSSLGSEYATRTASGGICQNSVTSIEASRYMRKYKKTQLVDDAQVLHCNNFLACLTCRNHIFVDSIQNIYELLSLREHLKDSFYTSEAGGIFGSTETIEKALANIEWITQNKLSHENVEKAMQKIEFEGVSILWSMEF